jgi:hypothetical protein
MMSGLRPWAAFQAHIDWLKPDRAGLVQPSVQSAVLGWPAVEADPENTPLTLACYGRPPDDGEPICTVRLHWGDAQIIIADREVVRAMMASTMERRGMRASAERQGLGVAYDSCLRRTIPWRRGL